MTGRRWGRCQLGETCCAGLLAQKNTHAGLCLLLLTDTEQKRDTKYATAVLGAIAAGRAVVLRGTYRHVP